VELARNNHSLSKSKTNDQQFPRPEGIATRSKVFSKNCLTELATSKNKQFSCKRSEVHNPRITAG
jgi:hypothetical protein